MSPKIGCWIELISTTKMLPFNFDKEADYQGPKDSSGGFFPINVIITQRKVPRTDATDLKKLWSYYGEGIEKIKF